MAWLLSGRLRYCSDGYWAAGIFTAFNLDRLNYERFIINVVDISLITLSNTLEILSHAYVLLLTIRAQKSYWSLHDIEQVLVGIIMKAILRTFRSASPYGPINTRRST